MMIPTLHDGRWYVDGIDNSFPLFEQALKASLGKEPKKNPGHVISIIRSHHSGTSYTVGNMGQLHPNAVAYARNGYMEAANTLDAIVNGLSHDVAGQYLVFDKMELDSGRAYLLKTRYTDKARDVIKRISDRDESILEDHDALKVTKMIIKSVNSVLKGEWIINHSNDQMTKTQAIKYLDEAYGCVVNASLSAKTLALVLADASMYPTDAAPFFSAPMGNSPQLIVGASRIIDPDGEVDYPFTETLFALFDFYKHQVQPKLSFNFKLIEALKQ